MFRSYRRILSVPGAPGFTVAGTLARLPISMVGIGIVLLVRLSTGSYALAGVAAGLFGVAQAVGAPLIGRAVDRRGQAAVTGPAIAVHLIALVALILASRLGAPNWTVLAAAVLAGAAFGSLGSLTRARWSYVLGGRPDGEALLHTAYSLESVLDEVVFVVGPPLVTVLATRLWPPAGLIAGALAMGVGGAWLLAQRATEPPPSGPPGAGRRGRLLVPGLLLLLPVMTCVGSMLGSAEVATVAFADARHHVGVAGWVLAAWALGSLLSGLGYGVVRWKAGQARRFTVAVLVMGATMLPLLLVTSLPALAAVMFVAGFAISPMIISGLGLVQEVVAPPRLTEGLTLTLSAISVGEAAGVACTGWVVEEFGARPGFGVTVAAGLLAVVIVLAGRRPLQGRPAAVRAEPSGAVPLP
jgi:MFS family permease